MFILYVLLYVSAIILRCSLFSESSNPCDPNPCNHGGVCTKTGDSTYTCTCTTGYCGKTCNGRLIKLFGGRLIKLVGGIGQLINVMPKGVNKDTP